MAVPSRLPSTAQKCAPDQAGEVHAAAVAHAPYNYRLLHPKAQAEAKPRLKHKTKSKAKLKPKPEPGAKLRPQPKAKPTPWPWPWPKSKPKPKPKSEAKPRPSYICRLDLGDRCEPRQVLGLPKLAKS